MDRLKTRNFDTYGVRFQNGQINTFGSFIPLIVFPVRRPNYSNRLMQQIYRQNAPGMFLFPNVEYIYRWYRFIGSVLSSVRVEVMSCCPPLHRFAYIRCLPLVSQSPSGVRAWNWFTNRPLIDTSTETTPISIFYPYLAESKDSLSEPKPSNTRPNPRCTAEIIAPQKAEKVLANIVVSQSAHALPYQGHFHP